MEFEIIPFRTAEMHWNALKWLEQGPCTNCVKLTNLEPSGMGTILVDVEITHPFDLINLTGFDVRGVAMFAGTHEFPESGLTTSNPESGEGELVNAEGFTSLYNPGTVGSGPNGLQGYIKGKFGTVTFPNSNLNGFMRYTSDDPLNTRNAFYAGTTITRTYEIKMPSGPFVFGYAVDANWEPPTSKPVTDPMTDFPPEANCPEAWKIEVFDLGPGLTDAGGSTKIQIDVYDWQGKSTILDPVIECPELFDGMVTASWVSDGAGFSTYEATVSNTKLADVGEYKCLIAVEDAENSSAPDWLDLTAYHVIVVTIFLNPNLAWAKRAGGSIFDESYGITALSDDSTVVTGFFEGSATFGPGEPNETILTAAGSGDIFIASYNPDGTLAWAKRAGGSAYNDEGYGITALTDNSTVVTGYFEETTIFGPGEPNETILTSAGNNDIFIARFYP